jgi:hypothetical protein
MLLRVPYCCRPPNVVKTFKNAGVCLVLDRQDDEQPPVLLCVITPRTARCVLRPISDCLNGFSFEEEDESDDDLFIDAPEENDDWLEE